jgi:gas vesicle protein
MSTGKVLIGVLAGVAAGALLGVLFAPDKGCETRRKVAKYGKDLTDDLNETLRVFMADLSDKFESILKDAKDSIEKEPEEAQSES